MDNGKVILCQYKIPLGYAKIKSVEDRGNYFLVTAEHIVKDVYTGIDYDDFIKVLPLHGFNIGFDQIFTHKYTDDEETQEHQIYAYNLKNNVIIIAKTFTWKGDTRKGFNSINVYCPQVSVFNFSHCGCISHGTNTMTVFDLVRGSGDVDLLQWINSIMEGVENPIWSEDDYPILWTYEDNDTTDEKGNWHLGKKHFQRLLEAPESLKIFNGYKFLKELKVSKVDCKHEDGNCLARNCYNACYM